MLSVRMRGLIGMKKRRYVCLVAIPKNMSALPSKADTHRWGLSELMLADKPRLGVDLGVINFFPRAVHKRPGAGLTDDCRHTAIFAIIRFAHFRPKLEGGRIAIQRLPAFQEEATAQPDLHPHQSVR